MLKTIDEKESAGLDKTPNKLLQMAADVIAPSLAKIFANSIHTGIFPNEWKEARESLEFKNGVKNEPRVIIGSYLLFEVFQKFLKKLSLTNSKNILTTTIC